MGRELAREHPADADFVMPVPDAATPAAIGYAAESGIPYREGLIKNRYIHRTFIQPQQDIRQGNVQLKFNPLPQVLAGKRVVLVDDSIVRGTTTPQVISMLRRAGAREVHMRITAPPMVHPCYLGVDTAPVEQLIAARLSVPEICEHIGADSLGYLSVSGLNRAIGLPEETLCNACFHGNYPMDVQIEMDKLILERA
jgi:amidophosphoribosyltransferase